MVLFFRTIILYSLVILVMRLMGKRQIGQLQPYELVVAIMISDLASVPMQNIGIPLISGIIPIITLLAAQLFISLLLLKSIKARKIICGSPAILIHNGKIMEENLRKEIFTMNDLIEAIRIGGYTDISEISTAILETNGTLSVFPKGKFKTPDAQDLSLNLPDAQISVDLVIDGHMMIANLDGAHITKDDLYKAINSMGGKDHKDVLICTLKDKNKFNIQLKDRVKESNK